MKRRGESWALQQFGGLVIALVAIILFVILGLTLANLFVDDEMKNSKSFIDGLNGKIENLGVGEQNTFALRSIPGWVLVGYNSSYKDRPEKCFFNSCLCLCQISGDGFDCQQNGYCRKTEGNVTVTSQFNSDIFDSKGYNQINVAKGTITSGCYIMPDTSLLVPFSVSKNKDGVLISVPVQQVKDYTDYLFINSTINKCPFSIQDGEFGTRRQDNVH